MIEGLVQIQRTIENFIQLKMPEGVIEKTANLVMPRVISKGDRVVFLLRKIHFAVVKH